jgi:MFS family permease
MPENQHKLNLSRQKRALLLLEWATGFHPAGSVWVLLLALRGFSLVEIGMAESLFHMVSLFGELPSGLLADLLGRKRTLLLSQVMFALCALLMAASSGFGGVCVAMAATALAYNLQSGTREAITYESMLQTGREDGYLTFSSLQNFLFRLSDGGAMLLAGATVVLGWRTAYLIDAAVAIVGLGGALALTEPERLDAEKRPLSFPAALAGVFHEAWDVLRFDKTARGIMALNALVGAGATLTRFFLQQRVGEAVPIPALLGPALFLLGLGGALAGLITGPLDRLPYGKAVAFTGIGVGLCVLLAQRSFLPLLLAAGLLSGLLDDALQLVSDKRLNARFPSSARATLGSVSSMAFSLTMIPLSPLFGWLFS